MSRRSSFWFGLTGLFVTVVLLVAGGALLYQAGQSQGYALGLAAASGDTPGALPPAGVIASPFWFGFPVFGLWFGLLCLLPLAFFFFMAMLRFFAWRQWGGHRYPGYRGWGRPHWGQPPYPSGDRQSRQADEPI